MNRLRILALVLCSVVCSLAAIGQPDRLPSYDSVYRHFFQTYDSDTFAIGTRTYLRFARKPNGWFIQIEDIKARKTITEKPLWDLDQLKWLDIDSPFKRLTDTIDPLGINPNYVSDSVYYALNLYYGYRGWEEDVIQTLQPTVASLPDLRLYQLGRAWSSLADYTLWPQQGWQNDALRYDSTWNDHDLSENLIRRYIQCQDSAIAIFGRLATRNPRFRTYVGDIETDHSNAYMAGWVMLKMLGRDRECQHYMVNGLFNPFVLAFYRNTLESCPTNAIWVTFGDNDLYEGLYLQAHDGIRPDVTIICKNYLSESRYVRFLTQLLPATPRLSVGIPAEFYKAGKPAWHYLEANDLPAGDASKRLLAIAANWKEKLVDDIKPAQGFLTLSFKSAAGGDTGRLFTWTPTQNPYLLTNDLFFADLFATNAFRRPIVFTEPAFGLDPYCHVYGMLRKVFPDTANAMMLARADDYTADWLPNRIEYGHLDSQSKYNVVIRTQVQSYLYYYYETVSALMMTKRAPKATSLLDKYFSLFPDTLIPFNRWTLGLIQWYYVAGQGGKGDQLIETLTQRVLKDENAAMKSGNQNAIVETDIILEEITKVLDVYSRTGTVRERLVEAKKRLNVEF